MKLRNSRVLVTGGAGFLGSTLVEQLVAAGAVVTVIDKLITGSRNSLASLAGKIKLLELDIIDLNWEQVLSKQACDVLFHLVGNAYVPFSVENPENDFEINLGITFRLLEALRKMEWSGLLIFPSSAAVYGNPARIPILEEDPTVPISPYGVSKLAAERYASVYSQLYRIHSASLRLFSVYGPRQRKLVIFDLIQKIKQNPKELCLYGDGSQLRDFLYSEDAARAMMLVAECGSLKGEAYNVASGQSHTILELAEILCRIMQVHPRFIFSGSIRPGEPERWLVNVQRLSELGFQPQISFEEGLRKTVEWVYSSGGVDRCE